MLEKLINDVRWIKLVERGNQELGHCAGTVPSGSATTSPVQEIGSFVARVQRSDLSERVMDSLYLSFMDTVANIVAGRAERLTGQMTSVFEKIIGDSATYSPLANAWSDTMAAHVYDYDDNHDIIGGHPSAVLLSVLLAVGRTIPGVSVRHFMLAYAAGMEVECKLGRCVNYRHYNLGWHPTATLGVMGAATAVAKLLNLPEMQISHAVGLAASMASGLKENFGSMGKPFQVGHAASMGLTAAYSAGEGIEASASILNGKMGFAKVYNQSEVDWSPLRQLGNQWDIADPGIVLKLYPCCASTHAAIDAALELRKTVWQDEERDMKRAIDIDKVIIYTHPDRLPHVNKPSPQNGIEAKFSIQYVVSHALVFGSVGLDAFYESRLRDRRVQELLGKVSVFTIDEPTWLRSASEVYIERVGEERVHHRIECAKGHGACNPASMRDIEVKFKSLVGDRLDFQALWSVLHQSDATLCDLLMILKEDLK